MPTLTQHRLVATTPLVIILLGPPGAGKGTHASPLSSHLTLPHISTGDLFREHIRGQTELGKKAKLCMDAGNLVPDELVFDMLFERIEREDCEKGYILDGFPRTLAQAIALDAYFGENVEVKALYFSAPDQTIVERIAGRATCKQCSRPYHLTLAPPKESSLCDDCKAPLYQRDDDKEDVVRKRLEVYHKQTKPVIEHYRKKNMIEVDAVGDKDEILRKILYRTCFKNRFSRAQNVRG